VFYLYTISIVLEVVSDDRKFSASVNSIIINLVFLEGGGDNSGTPAIINDLYNLMQYHKRKCD
jgi:hypothetical protein